VSTALVVIDSKAGTASRWDGRVNTHLCEVLGPITAEKVEAIRTNPEQTGEPVVEDPLAAT